MAAVDRHVARGLAEDRRVAPGEALDAVELAQAAGVEHHPIGAVPAAPLVADEVDARLAGVDRPSQPEGRVVEPEARLGRGGDGLLLAGGLRVLQATGD